MNPTSLWIPEFKVLWDRDKTEYKEKAVDEISYIVHLCAFYSPYRNYSSKMREERIRIDSFGKDTKWQPDDKIKAAVKKFNELQQTPTLRLLDAVRLSIESVIEFFEMSDDVWDREERLYPRHYFGEEHEKWRKWIRSLIV